ncbi:putative membrane transporter protein [uncultured Gammaproteobacteria bacterium]
MTLDLAALGPLILALSIAGLCAGLIAGLLGVGGGIVIVPVLFHVFKTLGYDGSVSMHLAVGTSLASIIPTALSSMRSHFRRGAVDMDLMRRWAPATVFGVLAGSALASITHGAVLTAVFASVALAVALHMGFVPPELRLAHRLPSRPIQWLIAALIGAFSAMMGIGGGSLTVPTLVLCDYPIRRAVATSSALGMVIAVPGTLGFIAGGWATQGLPPLSLGHVNLLGLALVSPASMLAAPLGAHLAHTIDPRWLRRAFAVFLALTAAKMFYALSI